MVKTKNPIAMQSGRQGRRGADRHHARRQRVPEPGQQEASRADQLPEKVRDLLTNKIDKTVYIKADARAQLCRGGRRGGQSARGRRGQIGLLTEADPHDKRRSRPDGKQLRPRLAQ